MVEKYEEERRKTERRKYDIGYEKYNEERRKQDRRQEEKETNKWNYAIVLLILLCLSIFVFMISFGNWSNEEIVRGVKEVILRYDANGGINAPSAQIRIEGENLVIADTKPVREGYKFVGWSTEKDSDEVSYYPGDILEDDVDILYAKWEKVDEEDIELLEPEINTDIVIQETPSATPKVEVIAEAKEEKIKVTITFRIDERNSTTKEVIYKEKYGELPIPEKDGYDFEGWYLDKEYREEITSETIVENKEAHDVYPKWTAKTYEVSFELNGGAGAGALVRPVSVIYDTAYGTLPNVEKTGYTFNGWYLDNETFKNRIDGSSIVKTAGNHTLYAKWVANEYIVVFELNGGMTQGGTSTIDPIKVVYNSAYGELPIAVAKGYTFDGWYLDNETFKEKVTKETIVKKAELHRLYAGWKINKYEVTFDLNGGVINGDDSEKINVTYNSEYGELPEVEKEGYTFNGWYLDNGTFENEITEDTILDIDENHTIYVKWIANEYEASFELNGGVGVADPITVTYDTAYGELPSPTKEGYTFNSWHLDDETYGNRVDSNSIVKTAENHILYAKWIANEYEVTFELNGGAIIGDDSNKTDVIYDATYGELPEVEKEGYTFDGWYLDNGTFENEITENTSVDIAENHTLYAKWIVNEYEITFELSGGSIIGGDSNKTNVTYDGEYGELLGVEKEGYTFDGWYLDNETFSNSVESNTIVKTAENHTLYAKWEANEYEVTLEIHGGTIIGTGSNKIEKIYDSAYGDLPDVEKGGYTLDGWYLDNGTFENEITEDTILEIAEDHTIYAKWVANEYEVSFELNGGIISVDDINNDEGSSTANPVEVTYDATYGGLPDVEKEGYTFGGWYLDNGTFENEITRNTVLDIAEDHILYAKWVANEYDISFELNDGVGLAEPITVTYDATYGTLPSVTKEGYTFNGWFLDNGTFKNRIVSNSIVKTSENHTLYAKWIANEYEVTFELNGGTVVSAISDDPIMVTYDATYGELPTLEKEGYTFRGWYLDNGTFNNKIESSSIVKTDENHMLYARWGVNRYTVSFELNGGVGVAEPITVTYDATYGELPIVTKEGYTFNGWYLENSFVNIVTSNLVVTKTEEHTLYAKWIANEYIVSFNSNGGSGAEQKLVTYDSAYGTLPSPTKTGYTFEAWYLDSSLTNRVTSTSIMNTSRAHTLYAGWIANKYEVSFSTNGGSAVASKEVTYDSSYGTLSNSTKTGYTFEGWYKESSLVNKVTSSSTVTTASNHTLYAKFEPIKYTVSYSANGGTGAPNSEQAAYDSTYTLSSTVPTKSGYTFLGWDTNEGVTTPAYSAGTTNRITIKGAIALHAIWKANTYTVSFNTDGGTLSGSTSITVTYGSTYGSLPTATKTGYTFSGWRYSSSSITSSTIVSVASNHTLVAAWTANTYTVTYENNGGTNSSTSKQVTYGSSYGTLATPTKRGYDFGGWYTTSSLTGRVTSSSTVTTAANHTLYAKWTEKIYTVVYENTYTTIANGSATYGSTFGTLPTPTRSGYKFLGWYATSSYSGQITSSTIVSNSSVALDDTNNTVKLYAKWEVSNYIVTFYAYGTTWTQSVQIGTSLSLSTTDTNAILAKAYAQSGETFVGWTTSAFYSATTTQPTLASSVSSAGYLYAVYRYSNVSYSTQEFDVSTYNSLITAGTITLTASGNVNVSIETGVGGSWLTGSDSSISAPEPRGFSVPGFMTNRSSYVNALQQTWIGSDAWQWNYCTFSPGATRVTVGSSSNRLDNSEGSLVGNAGDTITVYINNVRNASYDGRTEIVYVVTVQYPTSSGYKYRIFAI